MMNFETYKPRHNLYVYCIEICIKYNSTYELTIMITI